MWNQPVLRKGPNDARTLLQLSPFPAYGLIQTLDNHANSTYHGLALKATRRFSNGLTYLVGFSWSKALDQGSSVRNNTGENQFATDNYNLQREHSLSQFHNSRRFVTSVLYELPFGKGKRFRSDSGVANAIMGWMAVRQYHHPIGRYTDQRRSDLRSAANRNSECSRCDRYQSDSG